MRGLVLLFFVLLWMPLFASARVETSCSVEKGTSEIRRNQAQNSVTPVFLLELPSEETEEQEESERGLSFSTLGPRLFAFHPIDFFNTLRLSACTFGRFSTVFRPLYRLLYCIFIL